MPKFDPKFLDDIRARLRVSDVVKTRIDLKKAGAEFEGLSPFNEEKSPSFKVNDAKGIWHDFSADRNGDCFAFLVEVEGLSFPAAVERCAGLAGVAMPGAGGPGHQRKPAAARPSPSPAANGRGNGAHPNAPGSESGFDDGLDGAAVRPGGRSEGKREIAATFDYKRDGVLIYQTVRWQWKLPNGDWQRGRDGHFKKTFSQRRPVDGEPGRWCWGLEGARYVRMRNGDFIKAEGRESWDGERREFEDVAHSLYHLDELMDEAAQAPEDRRTVFLPEGEAKVDQHIAWGLVATCNSGGSQHWQPHFAEYLRGCDVVIEADNDESGRTGADKKARALMGIAQRVRVLDWGAAWPPCPPKGDMVDFKAGGGSLDQFYAIVDRLPDWAEPPHQPKFGLVMWSEQDEPGEDYDYLIEDLIPEQEISLIQGATQSGKSFLTFDMGMAVARGVPFFGRKVIAPAGIVYCAYEAGKGFRSRMRAYRRAHGLALDELPFALLTRPHDLWSDQANVGQLIDEVGVIVQRRFNGIRLGAVVIDTHNAATPGASEIDSETVSKIRDAYRKIIAATGAGLWIVGHTNAAGKHRGNEQLFNNLDTAIDVSIKTHIDQKKPIADQDARGRAIRVAQVVKQREGMTGPLCEFALAVVETGGLNKYGRPRTSCVVERAARDDDGQAETDVIQAQGARDANAVRLNEEDVVFFRALQRALEENGQPPPPEFKLPRTIARFVTTVDFGKFYRDMVPNDEGTDEKAGERYTAKIKGRIRNARTKLSNRRVIGLMRAPGDDGTAPNRPYYIWTTGRRVVGPGLVWPPFDRAAPRAAPEPPPMDHATGRPIDALDDDRF